MSLSYDAFYWRKLASLKDSGSKKLNAVPLLALSGIAYVAFDVAFGCKADMPCCTA
jgi:hypothetical protein